MKKLAVLISGNGSNLQSIIDSTQNGVLKGIAEISIVISNKTDVFGLERAKKNNIPAVGLDYKKLGETEYNKQLFNLLNKFRVDLICMAGYLKKLPENITTEYKKKILNIHPALLPKFGGHGMYGHFVHEAVVKSKEKKSGATVHFADENYDTGNIIIQKEIDISDTCCAEEIAKKILKIEHEIYPLAIKKVIEGNKL